MRIKYLAITLIGIMIFAIAGCALKENTPSQQGNTQANKITYKITKELLEDSAANSVVFFPQIKNYPGEMDMDYMNQSLKQVVAPFMTKDYSNVKIDYEVTTKTKDRLSVVYRGTADNSTLGHIKIQDSVNLDIASTNLITYDNFINLESRQSVAAVLADNGLPLDVEGVRLYFNADSIVFFYMPTDDSAREFKEVTVPIKELEPYLATSFGEHPVS